ncbi:MAG: 4Fe-4S binding protein [Desulfohalobiaceae bacterium]|nr:4Fe-4S binding protein [Desulfohalobiaceae bacterium]
MRRFADSLVHRAWRRASKARGDDKAQNATRQDPTEVLRGHLRSGAFSGSDGLDDYDADFSAHDDRGANEAEPLSRPSAELSKALYEEEAEDTAEEQAPEEADAFSSQQREKERAIPCEMILSRGRTLIVGEDEMALREHADSLNGELDCLLLLPGTGEESPRLGWSGGHACLFCPEVRISGSFGAFWAGIPQSGGMLDAAEIAYGEPRPFDLALDLTQDGVFASARPPLGYYWPQKAEALEGALNELPVMKGRFQKQHFIRLAPESCAHSHAGVRGCSRCIEACPYGVLGGGEETPVVDHLLCQGCLSCVSACPIGALEPLLLRREELLSRLEEAIARGGSSGTAPALLVHHEKSDPEPALELVRSWVSAVSVPVEASGLLGTECLLAALAMGAAGVVLLEEGPEAEVLDSQVRWARTILRALGRSPERVQIAARDSSPEFPPVSPAADASPARAFTAREKREVLSRAVQRLARGDTLDQEARELPSDACFGAVTVMGEACTLCMACAGACPSGALIPGGEEEPGLCFKESRCVQCGLCARVCPEQALSLQPRLSPERLGADTPVWLHREEPEKCRICGKPFASAGMLQRIRSTLWEQCGEEDPEWLTMCGDCRVVTLFQEPEDSA